MITKALDTIIVGGGMITEMQVLPSIYQLQRTGFVNDISICALDTKPLKMIQENESLKKAFPNQNFFPFPEINAENEGAYFPDLYKEVINNLSERNLVIIALPDHLHFNAIIFALQNNQHVLSVKPLCLSYKEATEIEKLAYSKGLFVGIEYHKRFDPRVGIARLKYRAGDFGDFRVGLASLVEPWYYRKSNFQNWCTSENSDMFTYIGCHYVDQVHMITGLLPTRVSVYGTEEKYPNGNKGYLWTTGRIIWENGACLTVLNGMGYPNVAPGGNSQGLWLFTQSENEGGLIFHDDQYRGVKHSYINKSEDPDSYYNEVSPDYFKLIERGGVGLTPVGYGFSSIEGILMAIQRVESTSGNQSEEKELSSRQKIIKEIDEEGIVATPANSSYNELVVEAGRKSILNDGKEVKITYGENPYVDFL